MKTKKILSAILLTTLCFPGIVFASWWNPLTWFKKKVTAQVQQAEMLPPPITQTNPDVPAKSKTIPEIKEATSSPVEASATSGKASSCVLITKDLTKGQSDAEVTVLQIFLAKEGYLNGRPNGTYGEGTAIAVAKLQFEKGISQSGFVDAETRKIISEISCGNKAMKEVNPFVAVFKKQNDTIREGVSVMCTKSTPAQASRALQAYVLDSDSRIASIESSLVDLKKDPRYSPKMGDALTDAKKSFAATKVCLNQFNQLISKIENSSKFTTESCSLVKNCMAEIIRTTQSSQSFVLILWEVFTPDEKRVLMNSMTQ